VLETRPELYDDLAWAWRGFLELTAGRSQGFAPNPIPMTEIEAWLRVNEITDMEAKQDFVALVRAMDAEWFDWILKNDGNASKSDSGNRRP